MNPEYKTVQSRASLVNKLASLQVHVYKMMFSPFLLNFYLNSLSLNEEWTNKYCTLLAYNVTM